ncbi:alpha/beta hydrolase [Hymenobacter sp. RP-2-7]|uniref:Alpha/beta hydrolase n=1 Tax=Hymenobacter polaris TaxID=2682546 RepID=A0A7Y0AHF1_9BACT|nr:alpha/beta hydrolase-fold protein [Hymenobacter polaris]NML67247.1 alpha/beta hydrolase [Hymenobacter polaris]
MKPPFTRLLARLRRRPRVAALTLRLTSVPASTPAGATIYLTGSCNGWTTDDPAYALAHHPADGSYSLTLPPGTGTLEYKFCRGTWATIETDADNRALPNRRYLYQARRRTLRLQVLNWEDEGGAIPPRPHSAAPNVHILAESFIMPPLRRPRRVWLYLPPDYHTSERRYPVLYLQDGQNVFDQYTSFAGEWGVDETLNALHAEGRDLGGCLVVAVDNGGPRRLDEYSPWRNPRSRRGGEGEQYVDFLVHTLKPYLDKHFRTRPEPASTGIMGSSMGALISVFAAARHPEVFGRVGVFSPAFWFAGQSLLAFLVQHPPRADARFYFLSGTREGPTMVPLMAAVREALHEAGLPLGQLAFQVLPDGQHAEWFWKREFAAAYTWLFAADLPAVLPAASPSAISLG